MEYLEPFVWTIFDLLECAVCGGITNSNNIPLPADPVFKVLCDVRAPPIRNRMKDFPDGINSLVALLNPAAYRRLQLAVSTTLSSLMDRVDLVYGALFDT